MTAGARAPATSSDTGTAPGAAASGAAGVLTLKLDTFEGPLDLLLHLIRSQQLDVRDIPIALVTEQYLACLELMQEIDIDVAGEWLVMAATLLHIKSKMLLPAEPAPEEEGEEADPRAELVRRLLEYERYKEAAIALGSRDLLERDVLARTFPAPDLVDPAIAAQGPRPFEPVSVFDLLSAFARVLASRPRASVHEIALERVSLADKIAELLDRLATCESLAFDELFTPEATRAEIVVSFLAVLELVRMRVIRAYQAGPFGPIRLFARTDGAGGAMRAASGDPAAAEDGPSGGGPTASGGDAATGGPTTAAAAGAGGAPEGPGGEGGAAPDRPTGPPEDERERDVPAGRSPAAPR